MIFVIGDSHSSAFSGRGDMIDFYPYVAKTEHFCAIRTGHPYTAHNLLKYKDQIVSILRQQGFNNDNDKVLLCVGEIDCRWHIPFEQEKHGISVENAINNTINNLFELIHDLEQVGYTCITYSCPATTWWTIDSRPDKNLPIFGTEQFRNQVTDKYRKALKAASNTNGVQFLDIFQHLVDDKFNTKREFYMDHLHLLSPMVMPLFLQELGLLKD